MSSRTDQVPRMHSISLKAHLASSSIAISSAKWLKESLLIKSGAASLDFAGIVGIIWESAPLELESNLAGSVCRIELGIRLCRDLADGVCQICGYAK